MEGYLTSRKLAKVEVKYLYYSGIELDVRSYNLGERIFDLESGKQAEMILQNIQFSRLKWYSTFKKK